LALTILSAAFLFTSAFFDYPKPLTELFAFVTRGNAVPSINGPPNLGGRQEGPAPGVLRHYSPSDVNPWKRTTDPKGAILWANGATIRVTFLDGDPLLWARVIKVAREWLDHANLKFEFGPKEGAYVRVTFDPNREGIGVAGYAGVSCRQAPPGEPTLTLSILHPGVSEADFRRVVLLGFGHVIGLQPEFKNPNCKIKWRRPEFYRPWSPQDYGIDKPFDRLSVMLPSVRREETSEGFTSEQPTQLSEGDKTFVRKLYPGMLMKGARPVGAKDQ
jgi:hypothetical protein